MSYMDQRVSSSTHPSSKRDSADRSEGSDEYETVEPPAKRSRDSPRRDDRSRRDSPRRDDYYRRESPRRDSPRRDDHYRRDSPRRDDYYRRDSPRRDDYAQRDDNSRVMNPTSDIIRVDYPIPENCVGLVIGRNGSEIQNISQKSGCRVQVNVEPSNTGYRMCEIFGIPDNIERAKVCINEVVSRAVVRQTAPLPYPVGATQPLGEQEPIKITIEIPIPASKCGSIIGKGGETMRKLRSWSNCNMQLIQEDNVANTIKPLRITGDPKAVEHAKQLVSDILSNSDDTSPASLMAGNGPVATMSLQVKVPRSTVGAIMGLQGKNIKKLSDETGTKIQFLPDDDPKLMERSLAIIGNKSKVYVAAHLIKAIVDANNESSNAAVALFYMSIPASKCGLVIGRGGETIKQINTESGAHCELSRDPNADPNEKTFVIRGSEEQVEHAKHLIRVKVGDIPPNTPYVPVGVQQQMQPPIQQQQHNIQMWAGHPIIQHQQPQIQQQLQPQAMGHAAQPVYQSPPVYQPPVYPQPSPAEWHQMQAAQAQAVQVAHAAHAAQISPSAQAVQAAHAAHVAQIARAAVQHYHTTQVAPEAQQMYQQPQQHYQQPQQQFQQPQQQYQQIQQPYQQPQHETAPRANALVDDSVRDPADGTGPSLYAQFAMKAAAEMAEQQRAQQAAKEAALKEQQTRAQKTAQNEAGTDSEPDYSAQWLEYYISIGDQKSADSVRARIEEMNREKSRKQAAQRTSSSSSDARQRGYY